MIYQNVKKYEVRNQQEIVYKICAKKDRKISSLMSCAGRRSFFGSVRLKVLMEFSNSVSSHNWGESLDSERLILHQIWRLQTENSDSDSLNKCRGSILG
jgi:hypothetical protein